MCLGKTQMASQFFQFPYPDFCIPQIRIVPEIMIPLIGDIKELKYVKKVVVETLTLRLQLYLAA